MFPFINGLVIAAAVAATASAQPIPDVWLTVAERTGFRETASHAQTMAFLDRAAARSPHIHSTTFGYSAEGRALPLVIVSKDGHFTPAAAHASGLPIVLIQSCIHPGEVAGKTASLMMLRDIALGLRDDLLDGSILVFVPIYNADGHERVSSTNRANQNGPEGGTGFRATAAGLDLNRDHLKLDSVEARALVELVTTWLPHIHVDNHVTNGSQHRWVVTWSRAEAPQLAPSLDRWLDAHMPPVAAAVTEAGYPTGPYVSLVDGADPSRGFDSRVTEPRYSTGYFTLRNRISILIEMYAHADFETRVLANREFLEAVVLEVGRAGASLIEATHDAEQATVAQGGLKAPPTQAVLRWTTSKEPDTAAFPVCRWTTERSIVTGTTIATYDCHDDDPILEVPWFHRPEAAVSVDRPRGYLVLPGWPQIEDRLAGHGLTVRRVAAPTTCAVETIRVADPAFAGRPYQGRIRVENLTVERSVQQRRIPAGSLWVPADQPAFEVAIQLLEPEAPDSLLRWGVLHTVFERKEYIGINTLDRLAAQMLRDPDIAAAWSDAIEDGDFAEDVTARYLWWYRKTAFWDETVGLLPVFRLMGTPELETEPWSPPGRTIGDL